MLKIKGKMIHIYYFYKKSFMKSKEIKISYICLLAIVVELHNLELEYTDVKTLHSYIRLKRDNLH